MKFVCVFALVLVVPAVCVAAVSPRHVSPSPTSQTPAASDRSRDVSDRGANHQTPLRLDISDHNITTVGEEELPHNVTALISRGNPLTCIADHAFNESLNTIQAIDIEDSLLTSLPVPALTNVISLTSLTISHGPMSTIPAGNVTILPRLQYLDLQYNHLSDITNISIFKDADKLHQVELGHNKIKDIAPLYDLQKTLRLNLVNNQIKHINPPAVNNSATLPAHLLYLWLSDNLLTSIPDLTFMPQLELLELCSNNITNTRHDRLPSSLVLLYLNHNDLQFIPHAVTLLPILRQLDLTNNRISTIDTFTFPSSLRTLNLQNNNIQQLHNFQFVNNSTHLTTLGLSGNPLTLISASSFVHLTNLRTLYLSKTHLTRLPLALLTLTQLTSLDMTGSANLTCTCVESSLSPWSRHVTSLTGTCQGGDEIKHFLNTLAKQCPDNQD